MVDEVDRLVDLELLGDVVVEEDEVVVADVLDVAQGARVEVVDADHAVPAREQLVAEVGAEEARSAGDHRGRHGASVVGGLTALTKCLLEREVEVGRAICGQG